MVLQVYDERGGSAKQEFTILVDGGNHAPLIAPLPAEIQGFEGGLLELPADAVRRRWRTHWWYQSKTSHLVRSTTLPGTFSDGNPASTPLAPMKMSRFTVHDGVHEVSQSTTFLITPVNQAPILVLPAALTIREGDSASMPLVAEDPEGDAVEFSSTFLPGGAVLVPDTGLFQWRPRFFQHGEYDIPFTVSDGELESTSVMHVTVLNANGEPTFGNLSDQQIVEGQTVRFRAFPFDPDNPSFVPQDRLANDELTPLEGFEATVAVTATGLPEGAQFDPETYVFTWDTDFDIAGGEEFDAV